MPDQLRSSASSTPSRYEPAIQQTDANWAQHYGRDPGTTYEARDTANVELAVQVAQRWILAKLRHETFFSLGELNVRIAELVADLNQRPMKTRGGSSAASSSTSSIARRCKRSHATGSSRAHGAEHALATTTTSTAPTDTTRPPRTVLRTMNEPTLEKICSMRLAAMAMAWQEQLADPGSTQLTFDERFTLLVDPSTSRAITGGSHGC